MKTNASPRTIIKAVEKVSAEKYNNNVVFRNYPKAITRYVNRFTMRTKDVAGAGSMTTKAGQRQPKVSWEVQEDVMNEILASSSDPRIYVDTVYGRKFSDAKEISEELVAETEKQSATSLHEEEQPRQKRQYIRKKKYNTKSKSESNTTLIKALKHLIKHPELLNAA